MIENSTPPESNVPSVSEILANLTDEEFDSFSDCIIF